MDKKNTMDDAWDGDNFDSEASQTYTNQCACGKIMEVSTQKDDDPEFYTSIFVRCSCGKSVGFSLPVN